MFEVFHPDFYSPSTILCHTEHFSHRSSMKIASAANNIHDSLGRTLAAGAPFSINFGSY